MVRTPSPPIPAASRRPGRLGALALTLALLLTGVLCTFPVLDFDLWWHLRTGELILQTHHVPDRDPFSYTAQGRRWVTHEWLSEVLFFLGDRLGGVDLLILLKALVAVLALALAAVAGMDGEARSRLPAAALGVLLAAPLIAVRAFVRPHMLTALGLGVALWLLRRGARTPGARWRVALLPLFLIWANLHSGFVLGLGLVALFWLGEAWDRRRAGQPQVLARRSLWFVGLVAVCGLNPHTWRAFVYPFALVQSTEVREAIVELRPIFHPAYAGAFFLKALAAVAVVLALLLACERRRWQWSLVLPGIIFAALALRTLRGVSEFAVLVPALTAAHGDLLARRARWRQVTAGVVAALAVAIGVMAAARGMPMGADRPRQVGLGVDETNLPRVATSFLRDAAPPGHVFNVLAFGGWFIHELWPGREVYIDGRLDVFPPGFLARYQDLMATGTGWDQAVSAHDLAFAAVNYAPAPALDRGLRARLREDPAWTVVCFGDNVVVYARRTPANAELIARFGCPFDPSLRTPESLDAWLQAASPADVDQAIAACDAMRTFTGSARAPVVVLSRLLMGRADRARLAKQTDAAVRDLERAVAVDPTLGIAHMHLGILCAEAGDLAAARRQFEAALRLDPGNPALVANLRTLRMLEARADSTASDKRSDRGDR